MKKLFTILAISASPFISYSQCTITNATSCVCADGSSDCDLLPDITISWYALETYSGGPTEYPQTGAGADNGRLKVTGSTPNIGYGPFCVRNIDTAGIYRYVCGTDTFTSTSGSFTCPNGAVAKQIIYQRIYHKNNAQMTYYDRIAGAMTPGMHVDDWGIMTLRLRDTLEPDPRNWSVVGIGHKQSFCLMDYGSCSTYNGHCRDTNTFYNQGTIQVNADFPNFGLGNSYGCDPNEQGCSSGWTDIYSESLNGMWINIPPNTCNGDYWIVYEIDPHDYFVESNETNNYTAIPFTLTQQSAPGNPLATITADKSAVHCANDTLTLTANAGFNYLWSNGATTQSIKVVSGSYTVTVTDYCGTAMSAPFTVTSFPAPAVPVSSDDTICNATSATFYSTGMNVSWYDTNDALVGTGNTFTTPVLTSNATYRIRDVIHYTGALTQHGGKTDSIGSGGYFTGVQGEIFDALRPLTIKSVQVYASGAGPRTIELMNSSGSVLQSGTFNIPDGSSRITINFDVPQGTAYQLSCAGTPDLFRNNGGVTYPYTITDTLSITGSSAGAGYYYFFYDWEIEVGGITCESGPAEVTATVITCTGINDALDLSNNFTVYPNPSGGRFNFEIAMPGIGEDLELKVTDLIGNTVYNRYLKNISGIHQTVIDLEDVRSGVYQLCVNINRRSYFRKLVIY